MGVNAARAVDQRDVAEESTATRHVRQVADRFLPHLPGAVLPAIHHPALVRRLLLLASAVRLSPYGRRVHRDLARYSAAGQPGGRGGSRSLAGVGRAARRWPPPARVAPAIAPMWLVGKRMGSTDPADLHITIAARMIGHRVIS